MIKRPTSPQDPDNYHAGMKAMINLLRNPDDELVQRVLQSKDTAVCSVTRLRLVCSILADEMEKKIGGVP